MSPAENKTIYRRFYDELLNKGNLDIVDELVDPNVVTHSPMPGQQPGAEGLKQAMASFREAFPDLNAKAEDMIAEGDKVVGRFVVTGSHQGEFMGLAPSGKTFTYDEIGIVRIQNGKIVEHWSVADALALMQQLGAIPE
jgi:steroid delta-isomerase-like uncharacterized protein